MIEDATSVDEITSEDVLDSRDLIALREKVQAWLDANADRDLDDERRPYDEYDMDDAQAIVAAVNEFESAGIADWQYGEAFIRDSYYARELAEDIGAISGDEAWPLSYINWGAAARALRMDYTPVDVNGVTYWAR